MTCKFCLAQLADDVTVCPVCGKNLTEEIEEVEEIEELEEQEVPFDVLFSKEKKEHRGLKIALAAIGLLLLGEVLLVAVLHFTNIIDVKEILGIEERKAGSSNATQSVDNTKPTQPIGSVNDKKDYPSYTADNATVEANGEKIVATLGNQKLTVSELQIHYWNTVSDFVEYYGDYVEYFTGLNPEQPLDQQLYDQKTGKTFQQWFLEMAIESWRRQASFVQLAEDAGHQMTPEQQNALDNMAASVAQEAQAAGYSNADAYVKYYFPGSSAEGYVNYNNLMLKAMFYYDVLYGEMLPTQEEMEAYYTENEAYYKENKLTKEDGLYYDIRHIFIPIEGDPVEVDGVKTYTEEQWQQCKEKAQKVLDDFLADGGTEALFAERAKEVSADEYSAANGGLYEQVTKHSNYVKTFMDWIMDEGRKTGDTGLVKNTGSTTQGYHIMYFCESYSIWESVTQTAILSEKTDALLADVADKWPSTIDYSSVVLGQVESK